MEILIEIIVVVVGQWVLSGIGWICLWVRYRDLDRMEEVKDKEYAGEYSSAGCVMILNFIAGLGALFLSGMLVAFLVVWVYRAIT